VGGGLGGRRQAGERRQVRRGEFAGTAEDTTRCRRRMTATAAVKRRAIDIERRMQDLLSGLEKSPAAGRIVGRVSGVATGETPRRTRADLYHRTA
jgi:hypothetical protein